MGVYTRLIKLIIFDATMAVSFAGASRQQLLFNYRGRLWIGEKEKKKYSKKNGYLFD